MDSSEKVFHIDLFVVLVLKVVVAVALVERQTQERVLRFRLQSTRLVTSCHSPVSGTFSSCSKVSIAAFWSSLVTLQVSLPDPESSESLADSSDSSSEDCFSPKRSLSGVGLRSKEQLS